MKLILFIFVVGMGSCYGGFKQFDGFGFNEEVIIEYFIYDVICVGFGKIVFVICEDIEEVFCEKFGGKFDDKVEIEYVFQAINIFVEGISEFFEWEKFWGIVYVVLVVYEKINEFFVVINVDDYYGISSFKVMVDFLKNDCVLDYYSMIGY